MLLHSVLSQLQKALVNVEDMQASLVLKESDIFSEWTSFVNLAQERLTLMKHFDSEDYICQEACYNMKVCEFMGIHYNFTEG
jgi:hypothetical protein